jgi:hypothetical protein
LRKGLLNFPEKGAQSLADSWGYYLSDGYKDVWFHLRLMAESSFRPARRGVPAAYPDDQ